MDMNYKIKDIINTVICDDCLKTMREIPDDSIDLCLTDAPYEFISKNPTGGGFMKKENKKHLVDIKNSFGMSYSPEEYLSELKRIMKKFNAYFFTNKSLLVKYINFAEENKYKWEILIWQKSNPVPINNGHYLFDKEYIIFIKESGATFNSKLGYEKYFTIRNNPIGNKTTEHPTEKPVNLLFNPIEISSNCNDIIFDGYLGSGSTAVAAQELHRNFIGVEINPDYVKIASDRLKQVPLF